MLLPFPTEAPAELLPFDGSALYFGTMYPVDTAARLFMQLLSGIEWRNDVVKLYGKTYVTKRKVAWYGDESFEYAYSNSVKTALPWTDMLGTIKRDVEHRTGRTFNSCLLNLYHDGTEGMSWHSDNEDTLDPKSPIASVSLGAARKFAFRHDTTGEKRAIILEDGSLLVMDACSQSHWKHALPKSTTVTSPRINLTFRKMKG